MLRTTAMATIVCLIGCGTSPGIGGGAGGGTTGRAGGSSAATGGGSASNGGGSATGGGTATAGGSAATGGGSTQGAGGGSGAPTAADVRAWAMAYKTAHPGNGGKDWDIVSCCAGASRTEASILADPDAVRLRGICGPGAMPVIPMLAWEYGGADHSWINPQASALVYCVALPASPNSTHWQFTASPPKITADIWVLFPDENPCKGQQGIYTVMSCLGDATNIEILVDTIAFHDGADIGVDLSTAPTDVFLILPNGTRVLMYQSL